MVGDTKSRYTTKNACLLRGQLRPHLCAVQRMQAQPDGGGEHDDRRGRTEAAEHRDEDEGQRGDGVVRGEDGRGEEREEHGEPFETSCGF
jgi:hypothetical protein